MLATNKLRYPEILERKQTRKFQQHLDSHICSDLIHSTFFMPSCCVFVSNSAPHRDRRSLDRERLSRDRERLSRDRDFLDQERRSRDRRNWERRSPVQGSVLGLPSAIQASQLEITMFNKSPSKIILLEMRGSYLAMLDYQGYTCSNLVQS